MCRKRSWHLEKPDNPLLQGVEECRDGAPEQGEERERQRTTCLRLARTTGVWGRAWSLKMTRVRRNVGNPSSPPLGYPRLGYSQWWDTKPTASTCSTAVDSGRQTSWSRTSSWQAFGTSSSTCPCVMSSTAHATTTCATGKHHTPTPTARSMPQSKRSLTTTSTTTTSANFSSFPPS